jgi:hypothetical protein
MIALIVSIVAVKVERLTISAAVDGREGKVGPRTPERGGVVAGLSRRDLLAKVDDLDRVGERR